MKALHCTIVSPFEDRKTPPRKYYNDSSLDSGHCPSRIDGSAEGVSVHEVNRVVQAQFTEDANGQAHSSEIPLSNFATAPRLLVWSAPDELALGRVIAGYDRHLLSSSNRMQQRLDMLAFTLSDRRARMLWRSYAVVDSTPGNISTSLLSGKPVRSSAETGIAFVFTGQGAQYVNMGTRLLQYPVFKETLQRIDEIFLDLGSTWSIFGM